MNEFLWFVSRASALVGLVLLSTTVILGITTAGRAAARDGEPGQASFVRAALHRSLSLVMVVAVGLHVLTAIVETYVDIGWLSLVVPFTSAYDRVWVGLGTLAFDLLALIVVTSLLRERIPVRWWRLLHWTAYAMWPVALLHGITTTTTDRSLTWAVSLVCFLAVVGAAIWRSGRESADARLRAEAQRICWAPTGVDPAQDRRRRHGTAV